MGCIQPKKLIKIGSQSSKEGSKNDSNNVVIHKIKKETTNDNLKNNDSKKETNVKSDDKVIHSNSQIFKMKAPINDNQSKSNYSKKNSSYFNHSESNSEKSEIYKLAIEHKNDINLNNLIDKDLKLEDKYQIINEEKYESFFQVFKIKLIDNSFSKEEFRSMIKIEKDIFGEYASDKKIAEEVSLLSQLDSRYIIKVFECFISNKRYYLITDHCQYGSLNEKLRNGNMYNENQIRYLVLQIFKAIKYLNMKNFLHIEISPEKILIYDIAKDSHGEELYNIKLLDFFCPSRNNVLLDNKSSFFCYMAPEVIEQKYSPTCDIWSIGIVIFQMFFGQLPHNENNDFKEYVKSIKSTYNYCGNISSELKDLLEKMLNKNPSRRITIDECLSHPWIHKQNTDIITDEEEFNKQLVKTKTKQSRVDKNRKKSGKMNNIESNQKVCNSENNSYKTNILEAPLHRNSSSIESYSNSNCNVNKKNDNDNNNNDNNNNYKSLKIDEKNDNTISNGSKADESKFNESTKERIKINSENNLSAINVNKINIFNKLKNNKNFKSDNSPKLSRNKRKNLSRMSSVSEDKKIEKKNNKKYPPLIEKTVQYIQYYILINYHKKREIEKLTKIFQEFDSKNDKYLSYDKVMYVSEYYKENKKISLENYNNYDNNNNNDKKLQLDEFINLLIDEKMKYISDNFKSIFESMPQSNINEIMQIYKDQEPIGEYRKYVVYIKDCAKVIQQNNIKNKYFYNEFITLLNNSIQKLHRNLNITTSISYNKSDRTQKSIRSKKTSSRNTKDKNKKINSPIKRSKTFLKNPQKNHINNNSLRKVKEINNHFSGKNCFAAFNPESFLQLIEK